MRFKAYASREAASRVHYRLLALFGLGACTMINTGDAYILQIFVRPGQKRNTLTD